jgi:DNA-binding SARP family transcriptional activator
VALEPLLESSVALVVRAHLDGGNQSAAVQAFQRYRSRLDAELHIPPSRELVELLTSATPVRRH